MSHKQNVLRRVPNAEVLRYQPPPRTAPVFGIIAERFDGGGSIGYGDVSSCWEASEDEAWANADAATASKPDLERVDPARVGQDREAAVADSSYTRESVFLVQTYGICVKLIGDAVYLPVGANRDLLAVA